MEESLGHRLNQFPPEVLDAILGTKASSYLVLLLWTCGNSLLNSKLASGITYMSLKASWSIQIGFPSVLLKLRALRHLSVSMTGPIMRNPLEWKGVVLSLPSTLETLKIASKDGDMSIRNFAPDWTASSPTYIETDYPQHPQSKSTLINLSQHMPHLTKLTIIGAGLYARDLPALPSSLTYLRTTLQRQGHPQLMSLLPRSLVRLRATAVGPANPAGVTDWLGSPPHLENIDIIGAYYPVTDYAWVPRSLRHVNMVGFGSKRIEFTDTIASTLPPNYESISVEINALLHEYNGQQLVASWATKLSPRLTTLNLYLPEGVTIDAQHLRALPHTLTDMNFDCDTAVTGLPTRQEYESSWNGDLDVVWPPHLLSLCYHGKVQYQEFFLFPKTLTKLTVEYTDGVLSHTMTPDFRLQSSDLSPNLTELSLQGYSDHCDFMGPLPSGLKRLELLPSSTDNETPSTLHYKLLVPEPLPLTLTDLCAGQSDNQLGAWTIPSHLTRLHITELGVGAFETLPRSLTCLTVSTLIKVELRKTVNLSLGLPPSLTQLTLKAAWGFDSKVLPESFSDLPRLKSLTLKRIKVPSAIIRSLPRCLKHFDVPLESFEAEDAPFLPPHLEIVRIGATMAHIDLIGEYWPLAVDSSSLREDACEVFRQRLLAHRV